MDYYDVTVVGAGVCGLIVSKKIAEQGYRVCVIEAKQDVGIETKCSALYSVRGIKKLGLKLEDVLILNVIRGGRFFSPSGKTITAHSNKDRAFVVEKKLFDKFLAREAAKSGVEFKFKTIAVKAKIDNEVKLKTEGLHHNIVKSKILVLAEGIKRRISKNLGFKSYNRFVSACRVEIDKAEIDEDIAPGIFLGGEGLGIPVESLEPFARCPGQVGQGKVVGSSRCGGLLVKRMRAGAAGRHVCQE